VTALTARLPLTLSSRAAFALQASILLAFLAASSAPTPLYSLYAAAWHFTPITTTIVFGIYAVAVLSTLLVVGALSDHVGRRPVILAGLAVQAAAMVVFADAHGVAWLVAARVVQGVSTGATVGALGAGMLDIDRTKGAIANAAGAMAGTATGALGSGALVQFLPAPTRLVYLALLAVFAVQALGVARMRETSPRVPGARSSLRPTLAVPSELRRPMLVAVPALVAVWALAGFYGSLGPSLVHVVSGSRSFVLGGLILFLTAGAGALTAVVVQQVAPRTVMILGASALVGGVAVTLAGVQLGSTTVLLVGSTISGVGFGGGFQGALRTVVPLATAEDRAGVISTVFVTSYLAMGVPAVAGGVLAVDYGVLASARIYGLAVIALGALSLAGVLARRPAPAPCT
jgi:MFS family permease